MVVIVIALVALVSTAVSVWLVIDAASDARTAARPHWHLVVRHAHRDLPSHPKVSGRAHWHLIWRHIHVGR